MARPLRKTRIAPLLAALVALAAGAVVAQGQDTPRCFGAASRDVEVPCVNRALDRMVVPTPSDAELMPNADCRPIGREPFVCEFGTPPDQAVATVALVGDSHATHWRAGLAPVAEAKRWYAVSLTRTGCPLSTATPLLREPLRRQCLRWREQVYGYFAAHPEITTLFVSEHPVKVVARRGMTRREAEMSGYRNAWARLPVSVQRIVVIRDTPYDRTTTADCVTRARRAKRNAGLLCAVPRSIALKTDSAAMAARRLRSERVKLVDLTPFMCDDASCYPVVGGALVHKDVGHITAVFGETLAPYLQRAVERAIPGI